jgi:hypothetical protein
MAAQSGGSTVHGTWDDLFRTISAGTYATEYTLGEVIPTTIGEYTVKMQIVAFNADTISGTNNTAAVSLLSYTVVPGNRRFNPAYASGTVGTGTIGGWANSELRTNLNDNTFLSTIQGDVAARIVTVDKYSLGYDVNDTQENNKKSEDKIWIPSARELGNAKETDGVMYSFFSDNNSRIRWKYDETDGASPKTRTAYSTTKLWNLSVGGVVNSTTGVSASAPVAVGFCVN